ncbi:MAG: DNA polymerase III subunit delta' [Clostridia bacterium]|nr:DNA polymerase III subunit delta' [Clostridia bacterium]
MDFKNIVGQKEVLNALTSLIKNDRVGHAYVFSGSRGIGKRTVAGIFAGMLLCRDPGPDGSCGDCMACRMYENRSNPDFYAIGMDDSNIGVDDIRKMQSDVIIRPLYSNKKVYLISNAENMTVQAQNCLLKILEEPPHYAVIILTTSNYNALMETIRSRTLRFSFRKNSFEEVKDVLIRKYGYNKGVDFIASYADGVIGSALELAGSDEFRELREKTVEIVLKMAREGKLVHIFEIYDFFETNKGSIDTILDIMGMLYRDFLVVKKTGKENILINSDKKDMILSNVSGFTEQKLARNVQEIETARKQIKQNVNYQLSVEVMLMKLL